MKVLMLLLSFIVSAPLSMVVVSVIGITIQHQSLFFLIEWVLALVFVMNLVLVWLFRLNFLICCLLGLFAGMALVYLVIFLNWPGLNYEVGLPFLYLGGLVGAILGGLAAGRRMRVWRGR